MKNNMVLKLNRDKLVLLIDVLVVIFASCSAYKVIFGWVTYLFIIPLCIHISDVFKRKQTSSVIPFIGILIMIISTALLNITTTILYYIQLALIVIAMYGISKKYSLEELLECFTKVITILAIISLVYYPLVLSTNISSTFSNLTSSNGHVYKVGFLYVCRADILERNHGCFWEPGYYATMIIICLLYTMYKYKTVREKEIKRKYGYISIVLIITLITTQSTAGIVLFFLSILFFITCDDTKRRSFLGTVGLWLGVTALIFAILNYNTILKWIGLSDNYFFLRVTEADTYYNTARYRYILNDLSFIQQSPIIGHGVVETNRIASAGGDTSTTLYAIVVFGLLGIQFTLYLIMGGIKRKCSLISRVVLVVIILSIINKEPHLQMLITWLLMFSMFTPDSDKHKNVLNVT